MEKEPIDLISVLFMKKHEFVSKFNEEPNTVVLPLFLKNQFIMANPLYHIYYDAFKILGMKVLFSDIENPNHIQVLKLIE